MLHRSIACTFGAHAHSWIQRSSVQTLTSKISRFLLAQRPSSSRSSPDLHRLKYQLLSRPPRYSPDFPTLSQSRSLSLTLHDVLHDFPFSPIRDKFLRPTHHLVYFPSSVTTSRLLPDGTEPSQSPGPPFTRRIWAGGSMSFENEVRLDSRPYHCTEAVQNVRYSGPEGKERFYVKVARVIYAGRHPVEIEKSESKIESLLHISESRTLVFMREKSSGDDFSRDIISRHIPSPVETPDFSRTMILSRELLFRFSALTFNAHTIHLDKSYCREVEGHSNLVVHGPLTAVLMVEVLQKHLLALVERDNSSAKIKPDKITYLQYNNKLPLYADEQIKVCVKKREPVPNMQGVTEWRVWIEGPHGEIAVKGFVRTVDAPSTNQPSGHSASRTLYRVLKVGQERPTIETTLQEEEFIQSEGIPDEDVAFQNEINAISEAEATLDSTQNEAASSSEEKAEPEAEGEIEESSEENKD